MGANLSMIPSRIGLEPLLKVFLWFDLPHQPPFRMTILTRDAVVAILPPEQAPQWVQSYQTGLYLDLVLATLLSYDSSTRLYFNLNHRMLIAGPKSVLLTRRCVLRTFFYICLLK